MSSAKLRNLLATQPGWKSAFRELAIIVVGVLLALGVQAKWEERGDRKREREYLDQLRSDAAVNLQLMTAEGTRVSAALRGTLELYRLLRSNVEPPGRDSIATLMGSGLITLQLRTGVLDALIRTGDINLIANDTLRARLIAHDAELKRFSELMRLLEDIVARTSDIRSTAFERHSGSNEPNVADALGATPDFRGLRGDVEYRGSVRRRAEIQNIYARSLAARRSAVSDMLESLDSELRRF